MSEKKSQLDRFKEAARDLETDDDEERFNENLRKLAEAGKMKPMDIAQMSDAAIQELHRATAEAYASDRDRLSDLWGQFRVDETPDWARHVRDLEGELMRRKIDFDPIPV